MSKIVTVRLLGTLYPSKLKPLAEIARRFDKFNFGLCRRCRWRSSAFFPNPCQHRKNYAWKKCRHFNAIARNGFLADRVRHLTHFGLTLDEAIGLVRRALGEEVEP